MDLEQKIGQLLIIGFKGAKVHSDSPVIHDIRKGNIGGVILFDRFLAEQLPENNILCQRQTTELVQHLQDSAKTPLIIAVDQEGGKVNRFKKSRGFNETPTAAELGQQSNTEATYKAAMKTAALLAELGINLNLAPVVDLDSFTDNPIIGKYQRSFSNDPQRVADHAKAWIEAHHHYNIQTCLKHFPGHGSSRADSHLGFVDISRYWHADELIPYENLIKKGLVDSVMTGHLFNSVIDSCYPATLSKKTVTGLLRATLGFQGPIFSDDMQMRAITSHYGLDEAVCRAIGAGIDLLIFGNNLDYDPEVAQKCIRAIAHAVRQGSLPEEAVDAAWKRVQLFKKTLYLRTQTP